MLLNQAVIKILDLAHFIAIPCAVKTKSQCLSTRCKYNLRDLCQNDSVCTARLLIAEYMA